MKNILPIAAIVGAGYFLVNYLKRKAAAGENLKFELREIKIDTQKTILSLFAKIFYDIKLNVSNNGMAAVNIQSIYFNIKINGVNTGEVKSPLKFSIPRQSEQVITIKASLNTVGIALLIKKIIVDGLEAKINIDGYIVTDLGTIDVNFVQDFADGISRPEKKKIMF